MPIQWTEDLATGIAAIDDQHRELYAAVASLHAAMRSGMLGEVPVILGFLERYATQHFALEEREMTKAAYPGLTQHREAHQAFVAEYLRQRAEFADVTPSGILDLSSWLGAWLRDHVRRMDGEMARFLRPRGERPASSGAERRLAWAGHQSAKSQPSRPDSLRPTSFTKETSS